MLLQWIYITYCVYQWPMKNLRGNLVYMTCGRKCLTGCLLSKILYLQTKHTQWTVCEKVNTPLSKILLFLAQLAMSKCLSDQTEKTQKWSCIVGFQPAFKLGLWKRAVSKIKTSHTCYILLLIIIIINPKKVHHSNMYVKDFITAKLWNSLSQSNSTHLQ